MNSKQIAIGLAIFLIVVGLVFLILFLTGVFPATTTTTTATTTKTTTTTTAPVVTTLAPTTTPYTLNKGYLGLYLGIKFKGKDAPVVVSQAPSVLKNVYESPITTPLKFKLKTVSTDPNVVDIPLGVSSFSSGTLVKFMPDKTGGIVFNYDDGKLIVTNAEAANSLAVTFDTTTDVDPVEENLVKLTEVAKATRWVIATQPDGVETIVLYRAGMDVVPNTSTILYAENPTTQWKFVFKNVDLTDSTKNTFTIISTSASHGGRGIGVSSETQNLILSVAPQLWTMNKVGQIFSATDPTKGISISYSKAGLPFRLNSANILSIINYQ